MVGRIICDLSSKKGNELLGITNGCIQCKILPLIFFLGDYGSGPSMLKIFQTVKLLSSQ